VIPRRVLLVGATQGLGLALAQRYRAEGWDVVATTVVPSPALEALDGVTVLPLDITDEGQALALRDSLAGQRIDVLHIVAGILPQGDAPIWERADEEVLRVLKTNAIGSVRLATLLEPLVPEGGTFAFTSSGMGSMVRNTLAGADLYRVSKAALNMLVRSFAVTHGEKRAVLIICPGWAKTEMGGADATVEVADSVDGIYRLVSTAHPSADGAPFLEYTGDTVPW
jgi:NAD(P)-dependent dehydrogenase (short-subunit alcohol dehydrogenase family)